MDYALTTFELRAGGRIWSLTAIRDFLEASAVVRCGESPMFGVLWPGARTLADRVVHTDVAGKRVIELGCGLALPSLAAASVGAHVLATDHHPDAEPLLLRNCKDNDVEVAWARVDWTRPTGLEPAPLVLASDVLYAWDLAAPLAACFAELIAPGGEGWLTDPGRPWLEDFVAQARSAGMQVEADVADDESFLVRMRRPGP